MTPFDKLVVGKEGISLTDANRLLWKHKRNALPIVDSQGNLRSIVFRRDWESSKANPRELVDSEKRIIAAAALNTTDYKDRLPDLVKAGVDVVCFDSSSGYSEFQKEAALWARQQYPHLIIGGGNITHEKSFMYLAKEAGLDFIKIGIGGGSICITREQMRLGKGQASAVIEVAEARDKYFEESGIYIPIISDGSISLDAHILVALCLGGNSVMMGRYFTMCDESPPLKVQLNGMLCKPIWGEGSPRARNWQRYHHAGRFDEGIEGYVPCSGPLKDKIANSLAKIVEGMRKYGCSSIERLHRDTILQVVSPSTLTESAPHDVIRIDQFAYSNREWGIPPKVA